MRWCECFKASDLFKWLNIEEDTCKTKIDRLNRALEMFYMDTLNFPENIEAEWFWWSWLIDIETKYPIYSLKWIYATWCSTSCFVEEDDICIECWQCPDCPKPKLLQTFPAKYDLKQWQYDIICDNKVRFHQYSFASNQFIVYSKWPKKIETMNDDVCMSTKMKIAFQYLLERTYALRDREFNAINLYQSLYTQTLKNISWSNDFIPYSVWGSFYNLNKW